jgi:hypothetical protein
LTFTEITEGIRLTGIVPGELVEILSAIPAGNAVEIIFRKNDGALSEEAQSYNQLAAVWGDLLQEADNYKKARKTLMQPELEY